MGAQARRTAARRPVSVPMAPRSPDRSLATLRMAGMPRARLSQALARAAEEAWTATARAATAGSRFDYRWVVAERLADAG